MSLDSDNQDEESLSFIHAKGRIYYAAKDGHSIALYAHIMELKSEEVRNEIVNELYFEEDGQCFTPLCIAARYGRYKAVKMLLTNFKPDIEKRCTVRFDGHIVPGATALWCAASSGHLNVVKLLVQSGSNVNHLTDTHSTPLRGACFDGRLDIVHYLVSHNADINITNTYNNTCLMISSYKGHTDVVEFLLASGANPDEQAHCGATALHYAAECGLVEICSALLDAGASLKPNEFGMSPVKTAAERTRESVVEFFINRDELLTKEEKIDALELMGASFANDKDNYSLSKAYHYLILGMELRYQDTDNIVKKKMCPPVPAYENWIESQTMQDLQAIRYNHNSIHMESLTIRERILGRKCPDVAHPVVFRGAVCADNGRFDRCEILWLHALKLRQENKLSVQRDLLRFAQVFSQMLHVGLALRFDNVLTVLESCILEIETNKEKMVTPGPKDDVQVIMEEYESNIVTALYLLTISTKILKTAPAKIQTSQLRNLYRLVFSLNKLNLTLRDGQTLLHLSVNSIAPVDDFHTNDVCRFPCIDTVKLLMHCGASIGHVDCDRNTPLHTLTSTLQTVRPLTPEILKLVEEITNLFLAAGVHLDAVNIDGLTAAQTCTSNSIESVLRKYETRETCLKCLASRSIAQHKIKYKGIIPTHLESYVQLHSADKDMQ